MTPWTDRTVDVMLLITDVTDVELIGQSFGSSETVGPHQDRKNCGEDGHWDSLSNDKTACPEFEAFLIRLALRTARVRHSSFELGRWRKYKWFECLSSSFFPRSSTVDQWTNLLQLLRALPPEVAWKRGGWGNPVASPSSPTSCRHRSLSKTRAHVVEPGEDRIG